MLFLSVILSFVIGDLLVGDAAAESRWAVAEAEGVRWTGGGPAADLVTIRLSPNDEVEVLAIEGDRARVRKGADFGWVPLSALTEVAPPKPDPSQLPM